MNRKLAIAIIAASAAAAGSAFAEDYDAYNPVFEGNRTRADVQVELAQYKHAGKNPWSMSYNQLADFRSTRTRAQVMGEYIEARDRVAAFTSEDSGSSYLARHGSAVEAERVALRAD